jgi:limonene-1,2-epoxide hydrolase
MTPEEVVRAELVAWDRLNVDDIVSFFTPDAVWENGPIAPFSGFDEIRKAVDGYVERPSPTWKS